MSCTSSIAVALEMYKSFTVLDLESVSQVLVDEEIVVETQA